MFGRIDIVATVALHKGRLETASSGHVDKYYKRFRTDEFYKQQA